MRIRAIRVAKGIAVAALGAAALIVAPWPTLAAQPAAPGSELPTTAAVAGPPPPGTFIVHAIDVGTGLSIFVEGHDFTLLYDAGSNDDSGLGPKDRVLAYLHAVRPDLRIIDHLILSHPHKDHVEMMDDVLATYQVRNVWDSGSLNDTCGYRAFLDAVIDHPGTAYHDALGSGGTHDVKVKAVSCHGKARPTTTLRVPRSSQISAATVPLGVGAQMTILHADGTRKGPSDFNEASVVVHLNLGDKSVLLPGDGEAGGRRPPTEAPKPSSTEGQLLACCRAQLHSDILIASHHGSMTSSRSAFLDAVAASEFIVSVGPKAYSGTVLPDKVIIDEYTSRGTVWRTDLNDKTCGKNSAKIGPDADGKPGGCDNVVIVIPRSGAVATGYYRPSD
jgi:beta-lactamase superfamily II metal-dependent hydrolase